MIRVLVAEDMRILREALIGLLSLEEDLAVVASLESGSEIVATALSTGPDVAVLDIDLPGVDGLTAASQLRAALPSCRVLILTGLARPGHLRTALAADASGFLLKHAKPDDVIDAIRRIHAGEQVIDPQVAVAALRETPNPLTDRELDVLRAAATGADPDEIGAQLFLTYGTVRNYLSSAQTKLHARNRVDAIRIARDSGWL